MHLLSLSYKNISHSAFPRPVDQVQLNPGVSSTFSTLVGSGATTPEFEVRAGYLGMCVKDASESWTCSRRVKSLAASVKEKRQNAPEFDPLNLIHIAKSYKDDILYDGFVYVLPNEHFFCYF